MNEGIYFADPDLPFHVWVRVSKGANGYRWVLRETKPHEGVDSPPISDCAPSKDRTEGSSR